MIADLIKIWRWILPLHKGQVHVGSHRVTSTACRGHHPGLWTLCGQRTVRAVRLYSNTPLHYTLCINRGGRLPLQLSPERFMVHSTMILQILLEPRSSNALVMIVAFIEIRFFLPVWCGTYIVQSFTFVKTALCVSILSSFLPPYIAYRYTWNKKVLTSLLSNIHFPILSFSCSKMLFTSWKYLFIYFLSGY